MGISCNAVDTKGAFYRLGIYLKRPPKDMIRPHNYISLVLLNTYFELLLSNRPASILVAVLQQSTSAYL